MASLNHPSHGRVSFPAAMALLLLVGSGVLGASFVGSRLPGGFSILPVALERARDLSVLAALLVGAALIGSATLERLKLQAAPGAYQLALATGLGLVFHSSCIVFLAVVQGLNSLTLMVVLVAPIASVRHWRTLANSAACMTRGPLRPSASLIINGVFGVVYVLAVLSPPVSIDELTYHLAIPKEYLAHGGVVTDPGNFFRNFPAGTSMLYLLLMGLGSDLTPKILHGTFLLMTVVVARHHFGQIGTRWVVSWTTVLFISQWAVQHGVIRANVDFALTYYGLSSFLILAQALRASETSPIARSWPLLSGLFLGAALACKIQAVACVSGMAFVLAGAAMQRRISWRQIFVLIAMSFAVYIPFLARNQFYSFDPFVQLLSDHFGLASSGSLELDRFRLLDSVRPLFMVNRGWVEFFMTPLFLFLDGSFPSTTFDGFIDPLYLLSLPVAALLAWKRRFPRVVLLYLFGFYCTWFLTAPLTRYALPILPLVAFTTVKAFACLTQGVRFSRISRHCFAALLAAIAAINLLRFLDSSSAFVRYGVPAFFGVVTRETFGQHAHQVPTRAIGEVIAAAEVKAGRANEKSRRKVFMVFASDSFDLPIGYYNDPFYVNLGLLQRLDAGGSEPLEWLRSKNFGYVLFEAGRIPWLFGKAHQNPWVNPYPEGVDVLHSWLSFFRQRLEPRLRPVGLGGPLILYEIPEEGALQSGGDAALVVNGQ